MGGVDEMSESKGRSIIAAPASRFYVSDTLHRFEARAL